MEYIKRLALSTVKAFAAALLAALGTGAVGITDVDWPRSLSIAALAAIINILADIAGNEVQKRNKKNKYRRDVDNWVKKG